MSIKKRLIKSMAIALVGIMTIVPVLNTARAMEVETPDISYEEVINNIDYNQIEQEKNSRSSIPAIVVSIFKKIPKLLKYGDRYVDIKKFDTQINYKRLKNKKTGWYIERDNSKNNAHGGSYYKLLNKKGEREATLDKNGKILRK